MQHSSEHVSKCFLSKQSAASPGITSICLILQADKIYLLIAPPFHCCFTVLLLFSVSNFHSLSHFLHGSTHWPPLPSFSLHSFPCSLSFSPSLPLASWCSLESAVIKVTCYMLHDTHASQYICKGTRMSTHMQTHTWSKHTHTHPELWRQDNGQGNTLLCCSICVCLCVQHKKRFLKYSVKK